MLLTSAFSRKNSVISFEEWALVFKLFTTATRKLRVNPYNPDVAHHIINQLNKLLLRTHSALECEANESVHWRTF